jgi:hypothetical protein
MQNLDAELGRALLELPAPTSGKTDLWGAGREADVSYGSEADLEVGQLACPLRVSNGHYWALARCQLLTQSGHGTLTRHSHASVVTSWPGQGGN